MRLHLSNDIKIAGSPAGRRRLAFTAEFEPGTVINTSGNFHAERVHGAHASRSTTSGASLFNDRALPVTMVAGPRDAEKPLLEIYLTTATTGRTGLRRGARLGPIAVAGLARSVTGDLDLLFRARNCFLEFER